MLIGASAVIDVGVPRKVVVGADEEAAGPLALQQALAVIGAGDVWQGRHPAERVAALTLGGSEDKEIDDRGGCWRAGRIVSGPGASPKDRLH